MGNERLGERWFLMDHADNSRLFYFGHAESVMVVDCRDSPHLASKTSFTEEVVRSENCDDCFLALLRNDSDLHLAFLDVEDCITSVPFCEKTTWPLRYLLKLRPSPTLARKDFELNGQGRLLAAITRPSV